MLTQQGPKILGDPRPCCLGRNPYHSRFRSFLKFNFVKTRHLGDKRHEICWARDCSRVFRRSENLPANCTRDCIELENDAQCITVVGNTSAVSRLTAGKQNTEPSRVTNANADIAYVPLGRVSMRPPMGRSKKSCSCVSRERLCLLAYSPVPDTRGLVSACPVPIKAQKQTTGR